VLPPHEVCRSHSLTCTMSGTQPHLHHGGPVRHAHGPRVVLGRVADAQLRVCVRAWTSLCVPICARARAYAQLCV
jgi:hypothetical protein